MKFYSNPNRSVQRCLNLLFQNQLPLFLLHIFFRRISHEISHKPVYSPSMVKKTFQIYGIQIHIKCICKSKTECRHFYSPLHSLQTASFWKCFPHQRKERGWKKLWFALSKFIQTIPKLLGIVGHLYFLWFVIFFKCDDFTVL